MQGMLECKLEVVNCGYFIKIKEDLNNLFNGSDEEVLKYICRGEYLVGNINLKYKIYLDEEVIKTNIENLAGKEVVAVLGGVKDSSDAIYLFSDNTYLHVYHEQDCCEAVEIVDEESDDIAGGVVISFELVGGETEFRGVEGTMTWSFVKLRTTKGDVWQRWLGESNGYYSEEVDLNFGTWGY